MARVRTSKPPAVPKIATFDDALHEALPRPDGKATQTDKKNYAQRLSTALASLFATLLRKSFKGILPTAEGEGHESRARTAKGVKKLDVNYSTPELGLGLGVSIKTINFVDAKTQRYSKNYTRVDNELRAEAMDYHVRQPYSVLVALLFLPSDACEQPSGRKSPAGQASSFGAAVAWMRYRAGRTKPTDPAELFEKGFVALYDHSGSQAGRVEFFDVEDDPPRVGRPKTMLSVQQVIERITTAYDDRNTPRIRWAGETGEASAVALPSLEDEDDGDDDD